MNTTIQKKLAGKIAKRSPKKIKFDQSRLDEIKEAITRTDIRGLIKDGAITLEKDRGSSKGRIRKAKSQRQRGRRKGQGSRKGKQNARMAPKKKWMNKIRLQRAFLKELKQGNKITPEVYKDLYRKAKGGFFRTKRHVKLYLTEHKLVKQEK